ncbi:hypothetical protein CSKR_109646 [Clonorchis sinensis]|uniref:Uncharacterized protein n=1 Tax=Clonorchis sinensis TaxID=79923 RepID=A0A419PSK7_CLOSI|nr:hypothetical protein CSKR_109646 [Clonorchis sinensis]
MCCTQTASCFSWHDIPEIAIRSDLNWGEIVHWLKREFADRKALVLPPGGTAARHRKGVTDVPFRVFLRDVKYATSAFTLSFEKKQLFVFRITNFNPMVQFWMLASLELMSFGPPSPTTFSCSTLSVPNCHATRRNHEGWDTARLPKPRQGKSRGRGRLLKKHQRNSCRLLDRKAKLSYASYLEKLNTRLFLERVFPNFPGYSLAITHMYIVMWKMITNKEVGYTMEGAGWITWLGRKFTDRIVRGSNPTLYPSTSVA